MSCQRRASLPPGPAWGPWNRPNSEQVLLSLKAACVALTGAQPSHQELAKPDSGPGCAGFALRCAQRSLWPRGPSRRGNRFRSRQPELGNRGPVIRFRAH